MADSWEDCMDSRKTLFSSEFIAINTIVFLNYCNIALFFYFTEYLKSIPIPHEWFGFLIAVFSLVILVLRPIISPFSNPYNSRKWLVWSVIGIMALLCCYGFARSVISMTVVRVIHGVAYVFMTVAITSRMVVAIPREKSSLAFSIISIVSLTPYAIAPPAVVFATGVLGSFPAALVAAAIFMGLTFPLLMFIPHDSEATVKEASSALGFKDIRLNFSNPSIIVILLISVVVWTAYAPVFYFLNNFGESVGVANPGFFFTISSVSEIAIRLVAGSLMDKGNKPYLLIAAVLWLGICYLVMGFVKSAHLFFLMGLFMGLGWGLIMPLLSSIVFDISEPRLRAFNTNITFQMFQMGFFVGPIAGGYFVKSGGFPELFFCGGAALLMSIIPAITVFWRRSTARGEVNE